MTPNPATAATVRRTTIAAAIGNTVETYDYAVYGFLAAILAKLFFPGATPGVALLSAFAVFGAAFLVRPLGGALLGPLVDRWGRQPVLVATLVGMAVVSAAIGVLPTTATIGIAAPILLVVLRLLQGISAGGEYGTAVIYAAEFAPAGRKGAMASRVQAGSLAGLLLGAVVVLCLSAALGPATMLAWGWRVPFLLALPLGAVGYYLRRRLGETPEFTVVRDRAEQARVPDRVRRSILLIGVGAMHAVGFYMVFTYGQNLIIQLGFSPVVATVSVAAALVVGLALVLAAGRLSDRFGRRPVLLVATAVIIAASYPLLAGLTATSDPLTLGVLTVLLAAGPSFYTGIAPIVYVELFPVHARGTGVSLAYNITVALFAGTAVYVTQWLVGVTGDDRAGAYVLMIAAVISGLAAVALPRPAAPPLTAPAGAATASA